MPQPTGRIATTIEDQDGSFLAFCSPPTKRGMSLKDLFGAAGPGGLDREVQAVKRVAREFGLVRGKVVYLPNVKAMSGAVVPTSLLNERIAGPSGISFLYAQGVPADGVALRPGEGFGASTAGCGTLIASGGGRVVVAHAGLKSLVDHGRVRDRTPTRAHEGIVHAIAADFVAAGIPLGNVMLRFLFAVHPDEFQYPLEHPEYGEFNRMLYNDLERRAPGAMNGIGNIDLGRIVHAFADALGFKGCEQSSQLTKRDGFAVVAAEEGRNLIGVIRLS